ncbi:MAG: helix-turn-helix domain-containing protein [Muricoprocola sp.]
MSEFSNVLRELIQKKRIQIYPMAQYCHTDRSTMYKIINGKRNPPSEENFKRMCDFMHLAPSEYDELRQAYEITLLGETVYFRRKSVEKFIREYQEHLQLPDVPPLPMVSVGLDVEKWDTMQSCMALSNQLEVNHILQHILILEANKKEGQIGLFLQPDNDFLFGFLAGLKSAGNSLKIQQIICLDDEEEEVTVNISYLKYVLPLYLYLQQYDLYYYYDDIHAHYHSFNGFPCMILTSEYAITCTADLGMGIVYHDAKVVSMLWKLFHTYQSKCTQLFHPVYSVVEECNVLGSMGWDGMSHQVLQYSRNHV